jgi:hypothetical protein
LIIVLLVLLVLLAIALWQIAPRLNRALWHQDPEGRDIDPTGNLVPEDQAFKRPPDEGRLL